MSLGTLGGFFSCLFMVLAAIMTATDNPLAFWDVPSVIVVIGGTITSAYIAYDAKSTTTAIKMIASIFSSPKDGNVILKNEVGRIIRWGYIVQKNGLQGLESDAEAVAKQDRFLGFGIDLVVTGYTGDEVRTILNATIESGLARNKVYSNVLKLMGGMAPAFGMAGTLIGLVIMLGNMGSNPDAIGPSMAVALITTFYGVLAARMLFIPASEKITERNASATYKNYLLTEGLALLAERKSPRYIQDKMNSYLDPNDQYSIDRDMTETPA